jgi:hypothetical protein
VIAGGTRSNVVAAEARAEVDIRVARLRDAAVLERKIPCAEAVRPALHDRGQRRLESTAARTERRRKAAVSNGAQSWRSNWESSWRNPRPAAARMAISPRPWGSPRSTVWARLAKAPTPRTKASSSTGSPIAPRCWHRARLARRQRDSAEALQLLDRPIHGGVDVLHVQLHHFIALRFPVFFTSTLTVTSPPARRRPALVRNFEYRNVV